MATKKIDTDRAEAIASIKKMLKPGDTVFTIIRHASASGMSRVIDLVVIAQAEENIYPKLADGRTDWDAKPRKKKGKHYARSIAYLAARAMGDKVDRKLEGIRVGGCGMDMGFHLVYNLGATLWPNGTPKPHGRRNGEPDSAGGYALKHSWL